MFDATVAARAVQTSVSPGCWVFLAARVQVDPPPDTVTSWVPGRGPSLDTNATSNSPGELVLNCTVVAEP